MAAAMNVHDVERDGDMEVINNDLLEIAKKWKGSSFNDSLKLCSLVEQLGPFITSTNQNIRLKGMSTLADTISEIPAKFIKMNEVEHLVSFFCDRLKDHHSIVPHVLKGILTLTCCHNFPSGQAVVIVRAIFQEVHVPSHLQADRYCVYSIIFKLLQRCLKELQTMESNFVFEFIQVMDGERDPKCLLLALHTIPVIVCHFDLGVFVEDLFEVFSCYFPIDFNPPENDPIGITRTDLSTALQDCFLSTTQFSSYSFPLLLEKLDSDVVMAKLDSLHLLGLCFQKYTPESLKAYLFPLVNAICKEAISAKQDEVLNKLLDTLIIVYQEVSKSKSELGGEDMLIKLLSEVYKECEHLLQDSESLQLYPASKILLKVSISSQDASDWILSKVFPHFLDMFSKSTRTLDRQLALDILSQFINGAKPYASFEDENNPYKKYQEKLLQTYFSTLTTGSEQLHPIAMKGLKAILSVKNMMEKKTLSTTVEYILATVKNNKSNEIREDNIDLISSFTYHYPLEVKENIIPCLLQEILIVSENSDIAKLTILLDVLVATSIHVTTMEIIVPKLTSLIISYYNDKVAYCLARSLLQIAKSHVQSQSSIQYLYSTCINALVQHYIRVVTSTKECSELYDTSVMDCIGVLIQTLVQNLDTSSTTCLINLLIRSGMDEQLLFGNETRVPFHNLPANHQYIYVILLRAVLGSMKKEVYISEKYILALTEATLKLQEGRTVLVLAHCISAVLNKMGNDEQLVLLVNTITKHLVKVIEMGLEGQEKSVVLWIWITKAMLLRGYIAIDHLVKQLILFLDHNTFGKLAADGFHTILNEETEILTPACHANRRLLYKQHLFLLTLPQLLNRFNNSPEGQKANYMTAICHQLKFQSKPVLISEFPVLLPIISKSLHSKDPLLLTSILSNLADVMDVAFHLFENNVHSLVPQLLELVSFTDSMKVRMMSLKCLRSVTNLPHHLILPLRHGVIKKLAVCLDDKKRLVRKEAVVTRCKWFLVGEPGKPT